MQGLELFLLTHICLISFLIEYSIDSISSPCVNGGVCFANTTVFAYWCDCYNTGFKGPQCAVNVNECTELAPSGVTTIANCNNGTCVDLVGSYRCDCDPGFTGIFDFIRDLK